MRRCVAVMYITGALFVGSCHRCAAVASEETASGAMRGHDKDRECARRAPPTDAVW